jgi:four helix bundle protein
MDLAAQVYEATAMLFKHELYGLTSQLRRAATSVAANIAERQGRRTTGEFCHFLGMARGSLYEVETELLLARRLRYFSEDSFDASLAIATEVARLMNGLIN